MNRKIALTLIGIALPSAVLATTAGTQNAVDSIATLRSGDYSAYTDIAVSGYYGPGTPGGGNFTKAASCGTTTTSGILASGTRLLRNYSGQLYANESISKASYLPSNTTVHSVGFFSLQTAGSYSHMTSTVDHVWDTTNLQPGMNISGNNLHTGTVISGVTPASPVYTIHGSYHNGSTITYTGTLDPSVVHGMVIRMTVNHDNPVKVLPQNAILPGATINVVNTTAKTITIMGVPLVGIVGDAEFEMSDGGQIALSHAPDTGPAKTDQILWVYEPEATLSADALQDTTSQSLTISADDGGMHIVDNNGTGVCWTRVAPPPNITGWGAKCDGTTDDTGAIVNNETWAEISGATHGLYGDIKLPSGGSTCLLSNVWLLKPVHWSGGGRDQSVLQQTTDDGPLMHILPWHGDDTSYNDLPGPEPSLQDITLRGDATGNSGNYGILLDGLSNVPASPSAYHFYMRNLTVEAFHGNLIQVNRAGGQIMRGYNIQLKGSGFAAGADCLHVDGPADTSRFYILVAAQCDYGQYLLNTTAWAEFGIDMFDNNSAVLVSGSAWPGINNPGVKFYDFQFDSNKLDGFIVDSRGAMVICDLCRSQGVGVGAGPGVHLYSDYRITANALPPLSDTADPVLILRGNLFTGVATADFPELYNISFDTGATSTVSVDGDTTTTDAGNVIATNQPTLVVGPDFHFNPSFGSGVALNSPVLTTPLLGTGKILSFGSDYTAASPCISGNGASALQLQTCDASSYLNVRGNSFRVSSGTNYAQIQAGPSMGANYSFTLPPASGTDMYTLASSGGNSAMQWLDWSRLRSNVTNGSGTVFTVTGSPPRWNVNLAYALFDIERSGPTSNFTDTFDSAANIVATLGATNLAVGSSWRGVVCNNTAVLETLAAGTGVTISGTATVAAGACLHLGLIVTNVMTPAVTIVYN